MRCKVTDPCYVIDVDAWDKICNEAGSMRGDWSDNFDKLVSDYLFDKTGKLWAIAGSTYYGDWSNGMNGEPVVKSEFVADSGMWCVVPVEFNERTDMGDFDGAAILEFDDGPISIVQLTDNNKEWAEFEVTGFLNGGLSSARSAGYNEQDE